MPLFSQVFYPPIPQGANLEIDNGGCDSITVTQVPYYPVVYGQNAGFQNCTSGSTHCCLVLTSGSFWQPILQLQKRDNMGDWVNYGPSQVYNHLFSNLDQGWYRVEVTMPQIDSSCVTQLEIPPYTEYNPYLVYNTSGQFIGYRGTTFGNVVPFQPPIIYYSDPVLVGPTNSNDIDWEFIQGPGMGFNAYDEGQVVEIDVSESKNYNMWFMAIFENQPAIRYKATGWQYGTMDDHINLNDFWKNPDNWTFEAFKTYRVQIAIENLGCRNGIEWPGTSWTTLTQSFYVCPSGTGCRFVMDRELKQLKLYPNPASNYVTLDNYHPDLHGSLHLRIMDMSGKLHINSEINDSTVDLSTLESGMYVVKIYHENNELHSSKLIIQ